MTRTIPLDAHGNFYAREGCDRCHCGCKYWENDHCIDCGYDIIRLMADLMWEENK